MASGPIFTDTSAWYAYIDKSDTEHAAAVKLVKNLDRPLITSNYIFDEVLTLVKRSIKYLSPFVTFRCSMFDVHFFSLLIQRWMLDVRSS